MGSSLRANRSGLMPLRTHLDFDMKSILEMSPRIGLALAQHTMRKLEIMEAPDWAFERFAEHCLLELPEFQSGWIMQAQSKDFFMLLLSCGKHANMEIKERIVLVARRFRDYKLLKLTVGTLLVRPLSPFEFEEAAELLHITSRDFSETASLITIDAFKTHGLELRSKIKEILKKKADVELLEETAIAAV